MTSVREQNLSAVKTLLDAIPGYTVQRNPPRDPNDDQIPAFVMEDGDEPDPRLLTGVDQNMVNFTVYIYAKGATLETAIDAAYVLLMNKLLADRTLGNLALDLKRTGMTAPDYIREKGTSPYVIIGVDFSIEYWTAEGDPEALGP